MRPDSVMDDRPAEDPGAAPLMVAPLAGGAARVNLEFPRVDRIVTLCQGRGVSQLLHAELSPGDCVVVTVAGVVADQSPDQVPGAVGAAVARWNPRRVLLDLDDVSVLDFAGIAALLASHRVGAQSGIPVILINVGAFLAAQLREYGAAALLGDGPASVLEVPQLPA